MRILFATDHSEPASAAVQYLQSLTFGSPAELQLITVVSAVPVIDTAGMGAAADFGSLVDQDVRHATEQLSTLEQQLGEHFAKVESHVLVGSVGPQIATYAEQSQADLVVVGALGHSAIERVVLGSVSDYVANHTQASVMVVRPQPRHDSPSQVLVAASGGEGDRRLVDAIDALRFPESTEITIMHVMQTVNVYRQDIRQRATAQWQVATASAEREGHSLQRKVEEMGYKTTYLLSQSPHIGEALIKRADEQRSQLIITGDRRLGRLGHLFLGSTSKYVLRHAPCSVLIARPVSNQD